MFENSGMALNSGPAEAWDGAIRAKIPWSLGMGVAFSYCHQRLQRVR